MIFRAFAYCTPYSVLYCTTVCQALWKGWPGRNLPFGRGSSKSAVKALYAPHVSDVLPSDLTYQLHGEYEHHKH